MPLKSFLQIHLRFENCEVQEYIPNEEGEEETVKSSVQVRKLRAGSKNDLAALESEAQKEDENAEKEKQEQESEMAGLRDKLKDIKSEMTKKNIEDQRQRLRLMEERKRQENLREFLRNEEDCLDEDLNKKAEDSASTAELMIKGMNKEMINDVMDSTKKNLGKEADKARLVKQAEQVDLAEAERKMNERMKNFLVQETMGFELVLDAGACYSADLAYNPKKYILKTCANMQEPGQVPNLEKFKDCKQDENFCTVCCAHFIGEAHEDKRLECKRECDLKKQGRGISVKVPIQNNVEQLHNAQLIQQDIMKKYTE